MVDRVIFDLDDTLLCSGKYYQRQLNKFVDFVRSRFSSLSRENILSTYDEIDREVIEEIGIAREHFPQSMVETYRHFCETSGVRAGADALEKCWEIGNEVYEFIPEPLPGMRKVLEELASRMELLLYTMGDPRVQEEKIEHHGLSRWFEEAHIFPGKSLETLEKIIGLYPPGRIALVGDSLRNEIFPACKLGLKPVHVQSEFPWSYHEVSVDEEYPSVESLPRVLEHLP